MRSWPLSPGALSKNRHRARLLIISFLSTKDGGAFIHIRYPPSAVNVEDPSSHIEAVVNAQISKQGGVPSWLGLRERGRAWVVRGRPYREVSSPVAGFSTLCR